jgi:alkylation response protein AidB-like acyl-CoA dehydrogenase
MARLGAYWAARTERQGGPFTSQVAMAKLFASRIATEATMAAMQVHGGYGFMREYQVERYFRDVKAIELGGGSNEILQLVIARSLIKTAPAADARRAG